MSWTITPRFTQWTPADISTALWLDAADAATLTTVSGAVSQWNDKSGNNRHLTQSTAGSRPAYTTGAINGLSALTFITDDVLQRTSPGLTTGASSRSMFIVYKPNSTTGAHFLAGQVFGSDTNSWFSFYFRNDAAKGDPYFATFAGDITDSATPTTTTKIGGVTYDGTTARVYRDGTEIANGARTLATSTSANFNVGRDTTGSFLNGQIAEIVFTENATSTFVRQRIEGYLAHKWGLTANLPSNHPYKVNPPAP